MTSTSFRPRCGVCGRLVPVGATSCPDDGSTFFVDGAEAPRTLAYGTAAARGNPAPQQLVGTRLGDYEVLEHIGEGGMGVVYRGVQPVIKKRVAIKVLRSEFASDQGQVKRLFAEAEAVNAIGHRNIIDIFNVGQLPDGRHYIVMEYLEGEPLDLFIRRKAPMAAHEALLLLGEICVPLHAAHLAGVIHRDLKPSNIFLCEQGGGSRYVKLLDFGLAKMGAIDGRVHQTSVNQIAGTPDYMAPEQARALDVSVQTDLYSLGVIAFQMLTGRLPFLGNTPMDIMVQHVSTPCPTPSSVERSVPGEVDAFVLWLLAKKPEDRPRSAEDVRFELKRLDTLLAEANTQTRGAVIRVSAVAATQRVLPDVFATPHDLTPADGRPSVADSGPRAAPGNATELVRLPDARGSDTSDAADTHDPSSDTDESDVGTPTGGFTPASPITNRLPEDTLEVSGSRAWQWVALVLLLAGGLIAGWLLGGKRPAGKSLPPAPRSEAPVHAQSPPIAEPTPASPSSPSLFGADPVAPPPTSSGNAAAPPEAKHAKVTKLSKPK